MKTKQIVIKGVDLQDAIRKTKIWTAENIQCRVLSTQALEEGDTIIVTYEHDKYLKG
jgi:hypothetical protein